MTGTTRSGASPPLKSACIAAKLVYHLAGRVGAAIDYVRAAHRDMHAPSTKAMILAPRVCPRILGEQSQTLS
jgi:hypothetical protein